MMILFVIIVRVCECRFVINITQINITSVLINDIKSIRLLSSHSESCFKPSLFLNQLRTRYSNSITNNEIG